MTSNEQICVECQECCKWMSFTLDVREMKRIAKITEFYKARGCEVKYLKTGIVVMIPHICPHLKKGGCDIYKTRPIACREYDGRKDPLIKEKCKLPKEINYG